MAEWLIEEGIGEDRALLYEDGHAIAARVDWPGRLAPGLIAEATLVARVAGGSRGRAVFPGGEEALVDRLPREASEGAPLRLEIIRSAITERNRTKLAHSRPSNAPPRAALRLREALDATGVTTRAVHRFPTADWDEIWADAWSGMIAFGGGTLDFSPTPAMTLVDVDGTLDPRALALAAVPAFAEAVLRFDLAGSVGIDFPTLAAKADRKLVDEALEAALSGWPHERTAMNGFGFVQIVSRLERPSLLHRIAANRIGAATRLLLRRAEDPALPPGRLLLTCHPAIKARLRSDWLDALARRTGRAMEIVSDPGLAIDGGFAQAVQP
ncbi:Rne/Rng family ribonuclease [Novosphingobium aquimarinum]|uniref:ribonuclease n=1 Tax=Novosphingobium aquimarinum TaxID=2682494 RepID=UPI0012EC2476|nr:ribonuclease [Novosphingobium aquimarinum]